MSLSFGYITTKSRKRADGITELHEIDLFEVSIVPHPANPDTRIIEMKSMPADDLDLVRKNWHDIMRAYMNSEPQTKSETLREKCARIECEHEPIKVVSFNC
jgi:hypothetical protein